MVHVTNHAIQRALERIPGVRSREDALSILSCAAVDRAAQFARAADVWVRISSGHHIAIKDGAVTTVLPADLDMRKMSSQAARYRNFHRAYALAHWAPEVGTRHRGMR